MDPDILIAPDQPEERRHQQVQALLRRHRALIARVRAVVAESRRQRVARPGEAERAGADAVALGDFP